MNIVSIGIRNVKRNVTRTTLTVLAGAVAVLAFVVLQTILSMWNEAAEYAAKDRLATRHKVSFIMPLPKRYIDIIRAVPGVKEAAYFNWFGGKNPRDPDSFFATIACDPVSSLAVYPEMIVTPEDRTRWLADQKGALIGDQLARKLHLKVGDQFTLTGSIFPGDWQFNIAGIYTSQSRGIDRSQFFFHWNYLNESVPERRRDNIGWVVSRIDAADRSAAISQAIDKIFDERDVQTTTMSERALNLSFMAGVSAVLTALNVVSIIILLIMMLILGNTIAMGVRERTREYGVLRALGFSPRHVGTFVIGEALTTGLFAGVVGVGLAYPLVKFLLGRVFEETMGSIFPVFHMDPGIVVVSIVLAIALGAVASLLPAFNASKLSIVDALRRVG
jgi:putative ABC transport system permease protein